MRPTRNLANTMVKRNIGFALDNWIGHKSCGQHAHQLVLREEAKRLDARVKTNDPMFLEKAKMAHKTLV